MQHPLIFNDFLRNSASQGFTSRQFRDSSRLMKLLGRYLARLRECCANMHDLRSGKNCQYSMTDAGMAAFSVFFTKSPSFLAHQKLLAERRGLSNCRTLFGMEKIPSDNQIRNLLAFALHTACDLAEKHWQKARTVCGTRDWMFRNLQVLTARFVFDD